MTNMNYVLKLSAMKGVMDGVREAWRLIPSNTELEAILFLLGHERDEVDEVCADLDDNTREAVVRFIQSAMNLNRAYAELTEMLHKDALGPLLAVLDQMGAVNDTAH